MHGKIIDFMYKPAKTVTTHGHRPQNSTAGGNGVWIVRQQVQVIVLVLDENNDIHQLDIAPEVRKIYGRRGEHVTKDRALEICRRLKKIGKIELSKDYKSILELKDLIV